MQPTPVARDEMQAAIGDNGRAGRRERAFHPAFPFPPQGLSPWPARAMRHVRPALPRVLTRVTLVSLALALAACQTAAPVPVQVRTSPGVPPPAQPAHPAPAEPGGAAGAGGAPTGAAPAPLPGSAPVGPSGRPLRTEPYGLKRGYGEPPRQAGGSGAAPVSGPGSSVAGSPGVGAGAIAGGATSGAAAPNAAGAGAGAAGPGPGSGAEAPPIAAPTVLPPASSLEQRPPVSLAGQTPAGQGGGAGQGGAAGHGGAAGAAQPPAVVATAPATAAKAAGSGALDGVRFGWPLKGTVLQDFGQTSSRGLSIGSRPKSSVVAAADGRVIFSGAGPREYGNLIIVKHANELLSVYANNSSLAVKEGQDVRRGQKIAEAGGAANRPQLHFEIRQQGKPIDPLTVLPAP